MEGKACPDGRTRERLVDRGCTRLVAVRDGRRVDVCGWCYRRRRCMGKTASMAQFIEMAIFTEGASGGGRGLDKGESRADKALCWW